MESRRAAQTLLPTLGKATADWLLFLALPDVHRSGRSLACSVTRVGILGPCRSNNLSNSSSWVHMNPNVARAVAGVPEDFTYGNVADMTESGLVFLSDSAAIYSYRLSKQYIRAG